MVLAGAIEQPEVPSGPLEDRIRKTLEITERWGYALRDDRLARILYGGAEDVGAVAETLRRMPGILHRDGFAALAGDQALLDRSIDRGRTNGPLSPKYEGIAEEFAADLLRHCPHVLAVSLSGSAASDGLGKGDDVDFNVFAEDGAKYVVYLTGIMLGVKYSLRHWRGFGNGSFFGLLPKVTCMNVVWTDGQCRPFARRDEFLAFELFRSVPLAGSEYVRDVLSENPWLASHFPQVFDAVSPDRVATRPRSMVAKVLRWLTATPGRRRAVDRMCRRVAFALHRLVDLSRERDGAAAERAAFLRHAKYPYDVFQD